MTLSRSKLLTHGMKRILAAGAVTLAVCLPAGQAKAQDAAARALLPQEVRERGVLTAGMPLDYEPYNFLDAQGRQLGLDVDVFDGIAAQLGLRPQITRMGFASLIPAVAGGRIDVGMAGISIMPARLNAVSFVRYSVSNNGLVVAKGNPAHVNTQNACGHTIALEKGTSPQLFWEAAAAGCTREGKPKMTLLIFDGEGPQMLAVQSGRAEAAGVGFATAVVVAQHSGGRLEVAAGGPAPGRMDDAGIAFSKDDAQLGRAIEAALKTMVANGSYDAIFAKWKVSPLRSQPLLVQEEQ